VTEAVDGVPSRPNGETVGPGARGATNEGEGAAATNGRGGR
jgi:hypothetical protein